MSLKFIYAMNYTKNKTVSPYLCFIGLAVIYDTVHLSNPLRISTWDQEEILSYIDTKSINNCRFQFKVKSQKLRKSFFFSCKPNVRPCFQTAFLWSCAITQIQTLFWYKTWRMQIWQGSSDVQQLMKKTPTTPKQQVSNYETFY